MTKKLKAEHEVDAVAFLESQHREVEDLFKQLEQTGDRAAKTRESLFGELAHKLECHTQIEEKIFYPRGKEVDKDNTLEAYEEHDVVKNLIKKISKTETTDESFMARVTVLKELVEHHVKEEESEYFPKIRKKLGDEELMQLGAQLAAEFEALEEKKSPRKMADQKAAAKRK